MKRVRLVPVGFIPEPFTLDESLVQPTPDMLSNALAAGTETPPDAIDLKQSTHYVYGQSLEFLGASGVPEPSKSPSEASTFTIEVATWWRVLDALPTEPFSIMAHLITSTGANLSVADGLDIAPSELQPSDVFVQRHVFEVPAESVEQELWLRTGLYQLSDLSRWSLDDCSGCDAIFIPLDAWSKSP